jgi:hypothetical protein
MFSIIQVERLRAAWKQHCTTTASSTAEYETDMQGARSGPIPTAKIKSHSSDSLYQNRIPQLTSRLASVLEVAACGTSSGVIVSTSIEGTYCHNSLCPFPKELKKVLSSCFTIQRRWAGVAV